MIWLNKNLPWLLVGAVILYVAGAVLAPVLSANGKGNSSEIIYSFYSQFCHQRVERSIFLFGMDAPITTHTLIDLKEASAIPEVNPNIRLSQATTYFGHGFNGNKEVGYKVAICIRDLAIFLSLIFTASVYLVLSSLRKRNWEISMALVLFLVLPLILDGSFQLIAETVKLTWVPQSYFDNNLKRVLTGIPFGVGIGLLIFPSLNASLEEVRIKNHV